MKISTIGSKPVILGTLGLLGGTMYWSQQSTTTAVSSALARNERETLEFTTNEGSGYYEGSAEDDLAEIIGIFIENDQSGHFDGLFPDFNESLKKAGKRDGAGREEKRERNRKARWERKQKNKNRSGNFLSLSRKALQRAEKRLKEIWTDQARDWVAINERSWEFGDFQSKDMVDGLAMMPDEHVGHVGHDDVAPAVAELLEVGQCSKWNGAQRPLNMYFAVQNTVPLHADNKRSDFSLVMEFVADMITSMDLKTTKSQIYAYNDKDEINEPNFVVSAPTGKKKKSWATRQNKQIKKSLKNKATLARPKIKPVIERLNADMESSDTTIMSGKTNVVFLFITNIPEDLDGINQGYLESQINELNQKAFVIVIFVHPLASDDLRSVPYRLVPKQWTHGLRDNEFAQRILIDDFGDLSSGKNNALINSIKNMLCLVDERIQCRLASRPWHEPAQALQMRSSPQIDSCCGHEISSKAYDSRFKTCCRDGTIKSWLPNGGNPCNEPGNL